jgi:hypothetical protein
METAVTKAGLLIARRLVILSLIEEYEAKGLGNCQNVATLKQELAQITFDKYKDKYPSYLFFTDEQFDEIVKRNGLVVSTIEAYTGFIPDTCFEAVKNENIDKEDLRDAGVGEILISYRHPGGYSSTGMSKETYPDFDSRLKYLRKIEHGTKEDFERYNLSRFRMNLIKHTGSAKVTKNPTDLQILRFMYGETYNPKDRLYGTRAKDNTTIEIEFGEGDLDKLHIAAPADKIDKSKKKESKFFRAFSVTKQEQPKDPIVFRYVKDGVLVITFWK